MAQQVGSPQTQARSKSSRITQTKDSRRVKAVGQAIDRQDRQQVDQTKVCPEAGQNDRIKVSPAVAQGQTKDFQVPPDILPTVRQVQAKAGQTKDCRVAVHTRAIGRQVHVRPW